MTTKSLVLAGALTLGVAGIASAQQYIYLTGSTAARGSVFNSMSGVGSANNAVFDDAGGPTIVTQGPNSAASKADYMTFSGHMKGTTVGLVTKVKCHWTGSEAGISDVANNPSQQNTFLDDSAATSTTGDPGPTISSAVDLAMADNDKQFSKNPNANITGTQVGIIPFEYVAQKGSNAHFSNVTDAQIRNLMGSLGGVPDALFTGSAADFAVDHYVYLSGRNSNSGTRVNTYGIPRYGIFSAAHQVQVNTSGAMINQTGGGFPGAYVGDYGYESGGDVANQMGVSLATSSDPGAPGTPFSVIGYMGTGDAGTAVGLGATALTYNGVAFSTAAVQQGQYGYWGIEFLYHASGASSQAITAFNLLTPTTTGINHFADGTKLIDITTMVASRNGPTSDPVHNP